MSATTFAEALTKVIARRDQLNALIGRIEAVQKDLESAMREETTRVLFPSKKTAPATDGTIIAAAVEILKRKPLKTKELLTQMDKSGFKVGGKRPLVTLYSTLNRSKLVVKHKSGEWSVRFA